MLVDQIFRLQALLAEPTGLQFPLGLPSVVNDLECLARLTNAFVGR